MMDLQADPGSFGGKENGKGIGGIALGRDRLTMKPKAIPKDGKGNKVGSNDRKAIGRQEMVFIKCPFAAECQFFIKQIDLSQVDDAFLGDRFLPESVKTRKTSDKQCHYGTEVIPYSIHKAGLLIELNQ